MKKPSETARTLPVPSSYDFDDTPKAFKRMLQRKNGDTEAYKKSKQQQADHHHFKRSAAEQPPVTDKKQKVSDNTQSKSQSQDSNSIKTFTAPASLSLATGFKTVRAKRKAHLQSRDLKKKLKRFDASRELPSHPSHTRKHVRDVVQEPPKLHQPKKTFKKVKDEREELKSWSDYEDELEAEEAMKQEEQKNARNKNMKKNK